MENQPKEQESQEHNLAQDENAKTKTNKYTPEEKPFADGEGTKLDKAIDGDEGNAATKGA